MDPTDPRTYLWANVCALMGEDAPSLDRVAKRAGVGRGNVQRIREQEGTELKTLAALAAGFRIQVWQLLVPGLDGRQLPQLSTAGPLTREVMNGLAAADRETLRRVDAVVRAALDMPAPPMHRAATDTTQAHSLSAVLAEAFDQAPGDGLSKYRLLVELQKRIEQWAVEQDQGHGHTPSPPAATKPARQQDDGTQPAEARTGQRRAPRR